MRWIGRLALVGAFAASACNGDESPTAPGAILGSWEAVADMQIPRQEVGAARIGDSVYVAGGLVAGSEGTRTVEVYDLTTGEWSFAPEMPAALDHAGTVALEGRLFVMGGYSGDFGAQDGMWIFDPATQHWTAGPPLPAPRGAGWAVATRVASTSSVA